MKVQGNDTTVARQPRREAIPDAGHAVSEPSLPGDRLKVQASPPGAQPLAPLAILPGGLNRREMLNSNHPEMVSGKGIAVSTLPLKGKAHLDHAFQGDFEIFAHHKNGARRALQQAVVLHNPGPDPVTITLGASASHTTGDAPFRDHGGSALDDPLGKKWSGPGDASASAVLRGRRVVTQPRITLAPGQTYVLHTRPVPPGNEVTSQFRLRSDGPVHAAVLFDEKAPTASEAEAMLRKGALVARNPHDLAPTPPDQKTGKRIYGRAAGVQEGSAWTARATNDPASDAFVLAQGAVEQSFLINGIAGNTMGTQQVQTAPLIKRYPDAAYAAQGNYGVEYDVTFPLRNPGDGARTVNLYFDSPVSAGVSRAFRGTVAIEAPDSTGKLQTSYVHVSQKAGERGSAPLFTTTLPPGASQDVRVRFIYPADATPPHALRLSSPGR